MARPSKSAAALTGHATKAELAARQEAESALATGQALTERPEVADSEIAHAEFVRVNALLAAIGRNDALYEAVINRYCLLASECAEFERMRMRWLEELDRLDDADDVDSEARFRIRSGMQKNILDADRHVQTKRKMMFDIEKECSMTISSALRSIPKAPPPKKNPLTELVNG